MGQAARVRGPVVRSPGLSMWCGSVLFACGAVDSVACGALGMSCGAFGMRGACGLWVTCGTWSMSRSAAPARSGRRPGPVVGSPADWGVAMGLSPFGSTRIDLDRCAK